MLDAQPLVRGIDEAAGPRRGGLEEGQGRDPERIAGRADDVVNETPGC